MTRPAQPLLTARSEHSQGSFTAGRDVVVGNDLRADLRVAHPLIARAHLLLRFDRGRWLAVDNNTLNGVYLDGRRVPVVDIRDGQSINIGKPDGPRITFELGRPPARSFRRRDAGRTAPQPPADAGEFPTTRVAVAGPEGDRRPVTGRAAWIGRARRRLSPMAKLTSRTSRPPARVAASCRRTS
uniref:FHA domain-containing protein n=1 Tax=Mycobacterium paraintracellulare TaxID=1138383 RepID=UPI001F180C8C